MYQVIFQSGKIGFLIWLLLFAVSTASLAIILRCAWTLRKRLFLLPVFKTGIIPLFECSEWQKAFDFCGTGSMLAAKIIKAVLLTANEKGEDERRELATEELDRRVKSVLRQINSLSMCGNIAPMLGLLGTVTGMVDAFMGLGTAIGPEKASILAIAISQALYTTAAGLLVAIPAIVFSVMFRNILERRIELVSDVLDDLLKYIPQPEQMPVPEGNLRKRSGR